MSVTQGKVGGLEKATLPTIEKSVVPISHPAAASSSLSNERNPLIDDLFDDLRQNSFLENVCSVGHVQGKSVGDCEGFSKFGAGMQRSSAASETSSRSSSCTPQYQEAMDIIRQTSQHFVHAMRMHELEDFFSPTSGEKAEDALRRQLCSKSKQEVVAVVLTLVDLLEEVRKARGHVSLSSAEVSHCPGVRRNRACSSSMISTVSTASLMRPPVHETNQLAMAYDQQGNRMINCYKVIADLGSGAYGKVKLGADVNSGQMVAIKIINKKLLKRKIGGLGAKNQEAALKREIAIMKKVRHRNCVSLYEVIDDPDSNMLYLIMEYVPNGPVVRLKPQELGSAALESIEAGIPLNGEVCSKALIRCAVRQSASGGTAPLTGAEIASNPTVFLCKPLSQHICAMYLRQLVSGLRYMHKRNVVHHDIKPDNILLGTNHRVFLTDFGVSEILSTRHEAKDAAKNGDGSRDSAGSGLSSKSDSSESADEDGKGGGTRGKPRLGAGTLLFTAPELFDSSVDQSRLNPHLTDVWALGVTLYCMLVGMSPFSGNSYAELRKNILTQTYPWCGKTMHEAPLAVEWRAVLNGLLAKDPARRWSLVHLKSFLDQESFQDSMRQSALHEASLQSRFATALEGDGPLSSTAPRATGFAKSSRAAAPAADPKPPLAGGSMASSANPALPSARAVPTLTPVSALPAEPECAARGFSWDLSVSEQELRDATRTVRVEVMRQRTVISLHTRAIVHRFVEAIRGRLRGQNFIRLSRVSPRGRAVCVGSPAYMRVRANASQSNSATNCSGEMMNSPQVPVLTTAAKFHQVSEVGSLGGNSRHPIPRKSRSPTQGTLSVLRPGGGDNEGRTHANGTVTNCNPDCPLQSLDAILSIVNLKSTSDVQSVAYSLSSSSASSRDSFSPRRGHDEECAGKGPGSSKGVLTSSLKTSSEYNQARGSGAAAAAICPQIQAPSTIAHTMIHDSAASSVFSEEDDRQKSGANGNTGRLMGCFRPKRSQSGATLSDDFTSYQVTLAPKSRSTMTPLRDSALYSACTGTGASTSSGHSSTSTAANSTRAADNFPAVLSSKVTSVAQPPGFFRSRYSVEPSQQRLCGTKLAAPVLSSYEEVPHAVPSKCRAHGLRKGA
ncbi:hypothetical protein LSCM1_00989 [Leishmania martiniquensis]|uniref:non-specific serine/threonine protein kinase n=1 Tax=Leishmania martiniquensis TaxID=1580590 RepID=A0A836FPS8_9TRYP|nr:hypothetical protein LSCM1_00989 [Leishmania martiniquensis]